METGLQRGLFAGLAGVAALALVGAAVSWLLPLPNAGTWIVACLVVAVLVVAAEIALLVLARRREGPDLREPDPHKGPGADDEVMDFVIDDDSGSNEAAR